MNTKIIAVILVVLGLVVLAYSGITFHTPGKSIDFLGMHFQTTVSHFISPAVGLVMLIIGILLMVFKPGRV
jgi:hypothetical protein